MGGRGAEALADGGGVLGGEHGAIIGGGVRGIGVQPGIERRPIRLARLGRFQAEHPIDRRVDHGVGDGRRCVHEFLIDLAANRVL